jgi:hypothetical protein
MIAKISIIQSNRKNGSAKNSFPLGGKSSVMNITTMKIDRNSHTSCTAYSFRLARPLAVNHFTIQPPK